MPKFWTKLPKRTTRESKKMMNPLNLFKLDQYVINVISQRQKMDIINKKFNNILAKNVKSLDVVKNVKGHIKNLKIKYDF